MKGSVAKAHKPEIFTTQAAQTTGYKGRRNPLQPVTSGQYPVGAPAATMGGEGGGIGRHETRTVADGAPPAHSKFSSPDKY